MNPSHSQECIKLVAVDDSEIVLGIVQTLFEAIGVEVWTRNTAIGLSGLLARFSPHIVVLDLNMPGIGGEEALERVKRLCPTARVVLFSDDPRVYEVALRHGVAAVSKADKDGLVTTAMRNSGKRLSYRPMTKDEAGRILGKGK